MWVNLSLFMNDPRFVIKYDQMIPQMTLGDTIYSFEFRFFIFSHLMMTDCANKTKHTNYRTLLETLNAGLINAEKTCWISAWFMKKNLPSTWVVQLASRKIQSWWTLWNGYRIDPLGFFAAFLLEIRLSRWCSKLTTGFEEKQHWFLIFLCLLSLLSLKGTQLQLHRGCRFLAVDVWI